MNKKYLLRGGVIGFCIALFFAIYLHYAIPCTDIDNCKSLRDFVDPIGLGFIYLPGIVLGTMISWIYGKIKSRKQVRTIIK